MLVVQQVSIDGFRATQMIQDRAQSEGNGEFLFEGCNAVLDHLGSSLRASLEAVVRVVSPLGKDAPSRDCAQRYAIWDGENCNPARRA